MPELVEQMYCSQQIVIPPKFPYILKRYCKAAIKTQPYDLLRWSFEYFKALSQHKPPPVKLRLEYPVYSTEGGLTRGCLKVLAHQLSGMSVVPLPVARAAWQGFCLDPAEFCRVLCLCEVYLREDKVPFLHFIAVAAGLLTKSLTHTMILLCETLTKEPDGGSAAICVQDFLKMYRFLARMDASKNVKYLNGYREGEAPPPEPQVEEEETPELTIDSEDFDVDFWGAQRPNLQKLPLINDHVARAPTLSDTLNMPVLGKIERSPSAERAAKIERESYLKQRKDKPIGSHDVDAKLRGISANKFGLDDAAKNIPGKDFLVADEGIEIKVFDEENKEVPYELYGEPKEVEDKEIDTEININEAMEEVKIEDEHEKVRMFLNTLLEDREMRREDLQLTFDEIALIVDRYNSASYDLGMVAGRQMSTTSGEFIVSQLEKEIMEYVDEQIAVLPDPELQKKKAKPEEVNMIRQLLNQFLDDNMDIIVPELEEVEEEEEPIPDIIQVYSVPGIGPRVDGDMIHEFEEYALDVSKVQADMFMPRNIRHFMCPPLEKYEEYKYEEDNVKHTKEEGLPVGGVITD